MTSNDARIAGLSARVDFAASSRGHKAARAEIEDLAVPTTLKMIEASRAKLEQAYALPPLERDVLANEVEATADEKVAHAWGEFVRFATWQEASRAKRPDEIAAETDDFKN